MSHVLAESLNTGSLYGFAIPLATPRPYQVPCGISTDGTTRPVALSELELDGWGAKYSPLTLGMKSRKKICFRQMEAQCAPKIGTWPHHPGDRFRPTGAESEAAQFGRGQFHKQGQFRGAVLVCCNHWNPPRQTLGRSCSPAVACRQTRDDRIKETMCGILHMVGAKSKSGRGENRGNRAENATRPNTSQN